MKHYLLLILSISLCFEIAGQSIILNTADSAPYSKHDNTGFYDILLTEVMKNISLDLTINHYPSERSITRANDGYDDGEYARISGISDSYPNLIHVNEPLVSFNFVSIKKLSRVISHENWDDLKDLRIGYLRGWKIYEMNVGDGSDITILDNVESMFNMLLADRLDIILYSKLRAIQYIQDNNIEELEINNPPLSERPMYLYLNKKHIDLIPLIEQELKTLKEKGKYDEFYNQYLINP